MAVDRTTALLFSLGEGVIAVDADCRITFSNPAAQAALGYDERRLRGRDMREIVEIGQNHSRREPLLALLDAIEAHRVARGEGDFRRANGSTFPGAYTASPLRAA